MDRHLGWVKKSLHSKQLKPGQKPSTTRAKMRPFQLQDFMGKELEKATSEGMNVERSFTGEKVRKEVKERGLSTSHGIEDIPALAPQDKMKEERNQKSLCHDSRHKVQSGSKITTVTQRKIPERQKGSPSGFIQMGKQCPRKWTQNR